ncbi:MAG: cysteine hydrolase [Prevotella sp.]|nr:cysteine hydrolase [Prevotella sp.]
MGYREEAIECVKNHVLPLHKQIYVKYNGDLDKIYSEGYNSNSYQGRVIEPGKVYELSYSECSCPKVKCGLRGNPEQCECSRQSILYILSQLEPGSQFDVRIENTILRGGDCCTFRIIRRASVNRLTNTIALIVIDIQNDITKHYRDIIDNLNAAIDWAVNEGMHVVYIKHNNITAGSRTFKPGTRGEDLVPELKVVSDNIFVKTKSNALTSEAFSKFIAENGITEFYIAGADATACVKSTCFNMRKAGYTVHVFSDCVTSYDLKKIQEMLAYYEKQGCKLITIKRR